MHILYQEQPNGSFKFREVESLEDYDGSTLDGRLYYNGNDNDKWFELFLGLPVDIFEVSDDYAKALACYRLDMPDLFIKK